MRAPSLTVESLHFSFGARSILKKLSFSVPAQKLTAITGPTGCGKSTLVRVLSSLEDSFSGEVRIGQQTLRPGHHPDEVRWRGRMGVMLSPPGNFDWLSVKQGLDFILKERKLPIEIAFPILTAVGLKEAQNLMPSMLSGGMQKRLALARALLFSPQILLLDDPTAGLDPVTGLSIWKVIRDLTSTTTTLVATPDVASVFRYSDHVVFLVDGRCLFSGDTNEFRRATSPEIRQFIEGRPEGPIQ